MKIISGGQTGVDRAALDFAIDNAIECGGWCPAGRQDEFGRIPRRYPVRELPNAGSEERTLQNVIDSDGTLIFHGGQLFGGTKYTLQCCRRESRPHLLIDALSTSAEEAAKAIANFVAANNVQTLNVAGPRQSEWANGYDYVFAVLMRTFG